MSAEPRHLTIARSRLGVREVKGPSHNQTILTWLRTSASWLGIPVNDDETAWCGSFVASCLQDAGFKPPRGAVGVRALWWANFGTPLPLDMRPPLGAIAVFSRKGGGHVGFVVGMTPHGDLDVLGGNQGNAVTVARFARNGPNLKLVALRWPPGLPMAAPVPWSTRAVASAGQVT